MLRRTPLWAALRDSQGTTIEASDPIATAIGAYPALRALNPAELARELGISEDEAQRAISILAETIYGELARREPGLSLDELVIENGAPAPPVWMAAAAAAPAGFRTSPAPLVRYLSADAMGLEASDAGSVAEIPPQLRGNTEKGVVPVGYSWTMGQDRLHAPIDADPNDPGWPNAQDFPAFWRALTRGQPSWDGAYADFDPNVKPPWLKGDVSEWVRACWRSFVNYGPIPIDDADTDYRWNWDPELKIKAQRHVFWYQFNPDASDADPGQLCLQVQGWSEAVGAWLIAHDQGERVYAFHYRGAGEWRHVFDLGQWIRENWKQCLAYAAVTVAVVASIATLGVAAAAAAPAATAAAAAAGATAGTVTAAIGTGGALVLSLETAIASAIGISVAKLAAILATVASAALITQACLNIVVAIANGDAAGVLYAVRSLWGEVQKVAGPEVAAWLKGAETDAQRAASDFFKPLAGAIGAFNLEKSAYGMAGGFSFQEIAYSIANSPTGQSVMRQFPSVTADYVRSAAQSFGPVGSYFFQAAQNKTAAELDAMKGAIPQWAAEYFTAGATVAMVKNEQDAAIDRAQARRAKTQFQVIAQQGPRVVAQAPIGAYVPTPSPEQPYTRPSFRSIEAPTPTPGPNPAPPPAPVEPSGASAPIALAAAAAVAYFALARK